MQNYFQTLYMQCMRYTRVLSDAMAPMQLLTYEGLSVSHTWTLQVNPNPGINLNHGIASEYWELSWG